ncbi:uncharacterized protein [Haliotis asinina]|uniref:uncharacterized protein n=1 Tax=Haliotis asinina TaxID=109174 RepID=UPI003531CB0A
MTSSAIHGYGTITPLYSTESRRVIVMTSTKPPARRLAQLLRVLRSSNGKMDLRINSPFIGRHFSSEKLSDKYSSAPGPIERRYMAHLKNMYRLTAAGKDAVIHTPGLSFESIDRNGNPLMSSLMRFVTTARIFATHLPLDDTGSTMFDYAQLTSDRLTFVASSQVISEKALYDTSVPKSPLDVSYHLGYVGKSSLSTVASIIVPSTGQIILRNINHIVGADKTSRRPKALPDWWREKHGRSATLKNPLIVPRLQRPNDAVQHNVTVSWIHTDEYNHTNYTTYVDYCINTLHYAIEKGCMGSLTKEVVKRGIKSMRNSYIGESLENDELTIWVWTSDQVDRTVHFDVQKLGQSVFQSTFVYHDE